MKVITLSYTDYHGTKSREDHLKKISIFKNYIGHASAAMNLEYVLTCNAHYWLSVVLKGLRLSIQDIN
jgi:hypothetical protein